MGICHRQRAVQTHADDVRARLRDELPGARQRRQDGRGVGGSAAGPLPPDCSAHRVKGRQRAVLVAADEGDQQAVDDNRRHRDAEVGLLG